MKHPHKEFYRYLKYGILSIVIIGILIAFSNISKLKEHFLSLNPFYCLLSLVTSLAVYLIEGAFLFFSLKVFGETLTLLTSLKYALIINSLGYLVSLGGLTPFATQVYILGHHHISTKKATLIRVLHLIFFNSCFNILLITGLLSFIISGGNDSFNVTFIVIAACIVLSLLILFYLVILWKEFRKRFCHSLFGFINRSIAVFSKSKRINVYKVLLYFDEFNSGIKQLRKKPHLFIIILALTIVDWILWIGVMYLSFLTMNWPISINVLIIGFAVGQIVGIISMIPGGTGTMEGSMALTYSALGIPFEVALGASLIYRLAFYIVPFFVSLPFYLSLKQKLQ